ncbi:MAG: hypothetical protein N2C12_00115, partial [Planctomycetales bacterium]
MMNEQIPRFSVIELLVLVLVAGGLIVLLSKSVRANWRPILVVIGIGSLLLVMSALFLARNPLILISNAGDEVKLFTGPLTGIPPVGDPVIALSEDVEDPSEARKEDLPEWAGISPRRLDGTVQMAIDEGPYVQVIDCQKQIDAKLLGAVKEYAENFIAAGSGDLTSVPPSFLRSEIVKEEFIKTTFHHFGLDEQKMYHVYLLLEFDEEADAYLRQRLQRATINSRLWYTSFGLGSAFILLGTGFSYLRIDQATAGKYKGRLKLASGAVILSLTASGALLVRYVV